MGHIPLLRACCEQPLEARLLYILIYCNCAGIGLAGIGQIEICVTGFGSEMWRVSIPLCLLLRGVSVLSRSKDQCSNSFSIRQSILLFRAL